MAKKSIPITAAIRMLRQHGIEFRPLLYRFEEHGGTRHAADELGLDEHAVIKTLVMEDQGKQPLLVLMHGDRDVSTKNLARSIGTKSISPCDPDTAYRHTGYQVGGISPFGARRQLPVYAEAGIFELEEIYINGGQRGFLVAIGPETVRELLDVTVVKVALT